MATGVIQKWRLVLMMSSEETVVMLMMMSVEAVVMLMMMSAEAVEVVVVGSVVVELEMEVVVMATAYDTTHSADRQQTMNHLCVRTPQAMLWPRQTCHVSYRWSRSTSCSNS